ncbi:helix-turn-helix transcriptional regulator [Acidithiobacillus sp. HP-11]|uniref:helix-turn-helix transcriptional regulator n=2 Tax=Acidithiobacillus TaxID=119977 RepID=UPI00187A0E55|nr:WYL domain-containing protein [Acidithiobacillus sp. HP-11]MBE7566946.1 WYL domain-containing protein [Acidithiobacillus sp. HP-11]
MLSARCDHNRRMQNFQMGAFMRDEMQFFRRLAILQHLPQAGHGKRTVMQLQKRLSEMNQQTTLRTIQRDLIWLERYYPIACDDGNPHGWFWAHQSPGIQAPYLEPSAALAILLGLEEMQYLLPRSLLEDLEIYRQQAERALARTTLANWRKHVVVLSDSVQKAPRLSPNLLMQLAESIETSKQVTIQYRAVNQSIKNHVLSIWGLALRDGVLYMVGKSQNHAEPALFAAHRIAHIEIMQESASQPTAAFVLQDFVRSSLQLSRGSEKILLRLQIDKSLLRLIQERPLSSDQVIGKIGRRWCEVSAQVEDTEALRWWILSFGENLRVLEPPALFMELRERTGAMAAMYNRLPKAQA